MLLIDNGVIELGVPLHFGLRVAHFAFLNEPNVFFVQPRDMTRFCTDEGWRIRGGHRLWLAPETAADYAPDNDDITWRIEGETLVCTQARDTALGVVKTFEITLSENRAQVTHRVQNVSGKTRRAALWALSVMRPGGTLHVPLPQREGGMDPLWHLSAWDYTVLGDERLRFEKDAIRVTQRPAAQKLKIGVGHPAGAVCYETGDVMFYKHIPLDKEGTYPDGGVSFECFISDDMAEIEGLSPLFDVAPGQTAVYTEMLELCRKDGKRSKA